tara:strand:+ start:1871 stop:2110 length:240 start_codon:yes stop_codon:yes gene_type:complete
VRSNYRKYHPDIKEMIIETRNPNLFPELNIPRTTALYWIKNAGKVRKKSALKKVKISKKMLWPISSNRKDIKHICLAKF